MSLFAKKHENGESKGAADLAASGAIAGMGSRSYGIAEAIQLLRGLPADQNSELVVRVVRATLASLDVRLPDIIEDASRKQKITAGQDRGRTRAGRRAGEAARAHRKDIAALEADLKETTTVKERLQQAEKSGDRNTSPLFVTGAPSPISTLMGRPLDKPDKVSTDWIDRTRPESTSSKD